MGLARRDCQLQICSVRGFLQVVSVTLLSSEEVADVAGDFEKTKAEARRLFGKVGQCVLVATGFHKRPKECARSI